jgi:hypothetical protein
MPAASREDIAEATKNGFAFLKVLVAIVEHGEDRRN